MSWGKKPMCSAIIFCFRLEAAGMTDTSVNQLLLLKPLCLVWIFTRCISKQNFSYCSSENVEKIRKETAKQFRSGAKEKNVRGPSPASYGIDHIGCTPPNLVGNRSSMTSATQKLYWNTCAFSVLTINTRTLPGVTIFSAALRACENVHCPLCVNPLECYFLSTENSHARKFYAELVLDFFSGKQ